MNALPESLRQLLADPLVQGALLVLAGVFLLLIIFALFRLIAPRGDDRTMGALKRLSDGQSELTGRLAQLSEAQMQSQRQLVDYVENRFDFAQKQLDDSLGQSVARTSQSLGALMERLEAIDRAQSKIEKLSGDVLGLQDILSNKQTRGSFGEIQLNDIVKSALPPDSFRIQPKLSNGMRADCLVLLPNPPGPIAIDSKFPLEAYEALRGAASEHEKKAAISHFRTAIRKHVRDISERYIIEGETADGAIMFLPSEAVYAELHANFADLVREGFGQRVWITSPTTCMATLTTMRAVMKDMRMREQAGAIRSELGVLVRDIMRLGERVGNLDRHFAQATQDIEAIKISTQKVTTRGTRLENLEFEEGEEDAKELLLTKRR